MYPIDWRCAATGDPRMRPLQRYTEVDKVVRLVRARVLHRDVDGRTFACRIVCAASKKPMIRAVRHTQHRLFETKT